MRADAIQGEIPTVSMKNRDNPVSGDAFQAAPGRYVSLQAQAMAYRHLHAVCNGDRLGNTKYSNGQRLRSVARPLP